jgi:hypothetical protein
MPTLTRTIRHMTSVMNGLARAAGVAAVAVALAGCQDAAVPNFNAPDLAPTLDRVQLQERASGLLSGDRGSHEFEILIFETMARDAYRIDPAEPRYITNPLGAISASAFIGSSVWAPIYGVVRGSNELIAATPSAGFLSDAEKAAVVGFGQTLKAMAYMRLIETRDTLGVPIIVNPGQLDPVRCKPAVLAYISALLDSAKTSLDAAGSVPMPFTMPAGFADFSTGASFAKFNRGLKAKIEMYRAFAGYAATKTADQAALTSALQAIDASFYALDAAKLRTGVSHNYSNATGDQPNGNFAPAVMRANPRVVTEADAGDARVAAKVREDPTQAATLQGVASDYLFTFPTSANEAVPILLDVELVLNRAEVLWGLNRDAEALTLSNFVRTNEGKLAAVSGLTHDQVIREILKQKRYSLLFASPDRLIDYRMLGLFGEIGAERKLTPSQTPTLMPFPQSEVNARGGATKCQQ